MTVHVGEITSEVTATAPGTPGTEPSGADEWEQRVHLGAMLERLERDRCRTATGFGDE